MKKLSRRQVLAGGVAAAGAAVAGIPPLPPVARAVAGSCWFSSVLDPNVGPVFTADYCGQSGVLKIA